jgi:hypothetical protein
MGTARFDSVPLADNESGHRLMVSPRRSSSGRRAIRGRSACAGGACRSSDRPRSPYELTEHGRATDRLLWELVRFGSTIDPDPEIRQPGNLRTLALPLRMMLELVADRPAFVTRLVVDDDSFMIRSTPDAVEVVYGDSTSPVDEEVETSYEPFLGLAEGRLAPEDFMAHHVRVVSRVERAPELFEVLGRAMAARRRA